VGDTSPGVLIPGNLYCFHPCYWEFSSCATCCNGDKVFVGAFVIGLLVKVIHSVKWLSLSQNVPLDDYFSCSEIIKTITGGLNKQLSCFPFLPVPDKCKE